MLFFKKHMMIATLIIILLSGKYQLIKGDTIARSISPGDSAFITKVQEAIFDFFWNEANPSNGLIKDRDTDYAPCSIASVGFGLTAICIGIEHQWITREQGKERVLTTLETFWNKPQGRENQGYIGYKGLFYHFLDMNTAVRTWESELSSIDTALLLAGILFCKEYFTLDDTEENEIRSLADSIYFRVDWEWMRNYNPNITLGWHPETGFINAWWKGYNEAMIMNILALGSPTHPAPSSIWDAWTSGYQWDTYYGYTYVTFPPLFGHQYSHCWIDFRNIQDAYMQEKGITYFENSVRATLAQRAYCIDNPGDFTGYSDKIWGITACDGPNGYKARGAPPAQNDDGTIAPTAAGASIAFTPQYSIEALRYMYDTYKDNIWKNYGFRDAFNLSENWWASDVIGIDQGAMIIMMENYLNESVWKRFMENEHIQSGLERAGFTKATALENEDRFVPKGLKLYKNYPNPFNRLTIFRYRLGKRSPVSIEIFNVRGDKIKSIHLGTQNPGNHHYSLDVHNLSSGIYVYRVKTNQHSDSDRMLLLK